MCAYMWTRRTGMLTGRIRLFFWLALGTARTKRREKNSRNYSGGRSTTKMSVLAGLWVVGLAKLTLFMALLLP